MFPRCFAIPQQGKSKSIFEFGAYEVGKYGASLPVFLVALGACLGAGRGFLSHSPPAYENSRIPPLWCNRFPSFLSNFRFKGILRGFIWVYRCKMCI